VGGAQAAAGGFVVMSGRWIAAVPLAACIAFGAAFDTGRVGLGALIGLGAFGSLLAAGAPVSVRFGAFGIAAAVMFGFMTAVLAELVGHPVTDLLQHPFGEQPVPIILGVAAVAFATLGIASLVWGRVTGTYRGDERTGPPH
jgi:hypothetical protein